MVDLDQYYYFRKELLKKKSQPYSMANEPTAIELYNRLKLEFHDATIFLGAKNQYICLDDRARKNLLKILKKIQREQEDDLKNTLKLISQVEENSLEQVSPGVTRNLLTQVSPRAAQNLLTQDSASDHQIETCYRKILPANTHFSF